MMHQSDNQQKILVVDDEEITRELIRACLEKEAYQITTASNGFNAIQCMNEEHFDLLIIDIQMDDMDGISLCELIHSQISVPPPTLMMTALDSEESVEKSFAAGAADYIRKPIDWSILKNKIKYIIETNSFKKQQKKLVSKYETIFNATANGLCAVDNNQAITFINAVALNILNLQLQDCIGRPCHDIIKLYDPENPKKKIDCFSFFNEKRTNPQITHCLGKFKLITHTGNIQVDCTFTPLSNEKEFSGGVLLFQDVTDKEDMIEKHRYEANHDALTKLPNRNFLAGKLPQALSLADRNNKILALLFIDLDSFKPVNDTYGHKVGDRVLQKISTRFLQLLRTSDTVCRIGGDEFVIILESANSFHGVKDVANKIIKQLNKPFYIDNHTCHLGGSIGISIFPHDSKDAETMLHHGDVAMYAAKRAGKNRCEFYNINQRSILPKWHKHRPKIVPESIAKVFPRKLTCVSGR